MIMLHEPGPFTRLLHDSGLLGALRKAGEDGGGGAVGGQGEGDSRSRPKRQGPYIGPRGGKWADPEHTIPWKEPESLVRMSATNWKSSEESVEEDLPPSVYAKRGDTTSVGPVTADMDRTQVEQAICSSNVEVVVAFDSNGKQIFRATNNDPWSCEFDTDWIDSEIEDLVHNHPTGSCPSPGDILAQIGVQAKRHRVAVEVDVSAGKTRTKVWVVHCPPGSIEDWVGPLAKAEELARSTASGKAAETAGIRGAQNLERWKRTHPREWVATLNAHMLRNYTALGLTITEEAHEPIKKGQPRSAEQQVGLLSHSLADAGAGSRGAGSLRGDGRQASQVARGAGQGPKIEAEFEGPLTRLVRSCFREATPPASSELPSPLTFTALLEQLRAQGILSQSDGSSRRVR